MSLSRACLLIGALSLSTPALAQDWKGTGRAEGKVLDPDGKPLGGVVVRLELPTRGSTELKTDKKGHWAILGLAGGNWNLDFSLKGYETKSISARLTSGNNPPIEVTLAKAAAVGPPPEVMDKLSKGDEAYKAGKYPEARAQYEAALEAYEKLPGKKPEVSTALHMQVARCYSQEKNYAKELEHLQFVLDADPTNVEVRKLMALEAFQGGLLDKGMELLKGLDETAIQDPDIYYNIGVSFFNNQKVDEAIIYLTRALTLNPSYADGYFLRGNAYLNLGKLAEAKADYKKFIEVVPPDDSRVETVKKVLEQIK
jgi:tetratricopeptide (TPR) repeat protein